MRRPFAQFTLGRMMIAVAFVGVVCWAIVGPAPATKLLLIMCLGPFVGACWTRLITLKPFDPATRPVLMYYAPNPRARSQDRLFQSIDGGIKGGLLAAVLNTLATAVAIESESGAGFLQSGLRGVLELGLVAFIVLIFWSIISALTGAWVGMLVGLFADAATLVVKGRQDHA